MKKLLITILSGVMFIFSMVPVGATEVAPETIPETIYKQSNKILLLSDILNWYGLSNATIESDTYSGYGDIPGIYPIEIKVDGTIRSFEINVRNTLSDVVNAVAKVGETYHFLITKDKQLTKEDIRKTLVNINLVNASWALTLNSEEYGAYVDNWNAPGTYNVTVTVASTSGLSETHQIQIIVSNSEDQAYDFQPIVTEKKGLGVLEILLIVIGGVIIIALVIGKGGNIK